MPTTQKPTRRPRVTEAARVRAEDDARKLDHITRSLEAAQKDLASIGGNVGSAARDLRRDLMKMLRDARRDLLKMRRAMERDFERLHRDLTSAATGPHAPKRAPAPTKRTARRQTAH